jgi:hypothetical protein
VLETDAMKNWEAHEFSRAESRQEDVRLQPLRDSLQPTDLDPHSVLNAFIGAMLAARFAGKNPANAANAPNVAIASIIVTGS